MKGNTTEYITDNAILKIIFTDEVWLSKHKGEAIGLPATKLSEEKCPVSRLDDDAGQRNGCSTQPSKLPCQG